jgi:hypothetical protein
MAPYVRAGRITPVQDHFAHSGEGPHDLLITERIAMGVRLAFLILFSMWGFQLSLSSRTTPKYFAVLKNGISWPYISSGQLDMESQELPVYFSV